MKKILIVAVIVLLLLASVPFAVGWVAANRYQHLVQRLDARHPNVKLEVLDYQRGLFSSKARLRATFTDPGWQPFIGASGLSYDIDQAIAHGPLVPTGHGLKLAIAGIHSQWHSSHDGPDIDLDGLLDLHANLSGRLAVADYDQITDQATIQLSGLHLDFSLSRDLTHFKLRGGVDSAAYTKAMGDGASLQQVKLDIRADRSAHHPWVGPAKLVMKRLELRFETVGDLLVSDFDLRTDSEADGNNYLQHQSTFSVAGVELHGEHYGPLEWQTNISNLDGQALMDLTRELEQPGTGGSTAPQSIVSKYLPALLRARPVIEVQKFAMTTPMGSLQIRLHLDVDQATTAQLASPFTVVQSAHAEVHAHIDSGLVRAAAQYYAANYARDADALLEKVVAEGWLVAVQDGYALDAVFQQGHLDLNGKPFTP